MATPNAFNSLNSSLVRIAAGIGLLVIVALPTAVGYSTYSNLHEMTRYRAHLAAERVGEYAYVQGKTWKFSDARIAELVEFAFPEMDLRGHLLVKASDGTVVAELGTPIPFPSLNVLAPIIVHDEGQGWVGISVGLVPWLWLVATVLVLAIFPGAFAFWSAKRLPKRAMNEAIDGHALVQQEVDKAISQLWAKGRELELALCKEKELNKLQRQFVSMASHEFRTPLTIIDTIAQGLKRRIDRQTPEQAVERIDQIRDAVKRMVRLMESTLMVARMEEGKVTIEFEACDVDELVRRVCERHQDVAQAHNINCELAELPNAIQADSSALEQVLTNLLSNAVKYSPDAPQIDVVARGEGDEVVISVRDRGLGIDEDDLACMFERFFRAKTSTGIAGTGIGLNLAKHLVEMHGGSIAVDSTKGEGSTFTVRLPIAGPREAAKPVSQAA